MLSHVPDIPQTNYTCCNKMETSKFFVDHSSMSSVHSIHSCVSTSNFFTIHSIIYAFRFTIFVIHSFIHACHINIFLCDSFIFVYVFPLKNLSLFINSFMLFPSQNLSYTCIVHKVMNIDRSIINWFTCKSGWSVFTTFTAIQKLRR